MDREVCYMLYRETYIFDRKPICAAREPAITGGHAAQAYGAGIGGDSLS